MKVKTIDGTEVEISMEEAKRIHAVMAGHVPKASWWDAEGKERMTKFYSEYQEKAAHNIMVAFGYCELPKSEDDVKGAIAQAFKQGDSGLIAEVVFEAMEWQTAYSALRSITE